MENGGQNKSRVIVRGGGGIRISRGVASIVICDGVLLGGKRGYYNAYSIRNARSGLEFADVLNRAHRGD
ncbi:MAG: hypothetical protein LBG14_00060 [Treponema sp.]|nr:hypothetical protein [Treponema sp.]